MGESEDGVVITQRGGLDQGKNDGGWTWVNGDAAGGGGEGGIKASTEREKKKRGERRKGLTS